MKTLLILMAAASVFSVSGAVLATSSEAHTAMINTLEDTPAFTYTKPKIIHHKKHRKHIKKKAH